MNKLALITAAAALCAVPSIAADRLGPPVDQFNTMDRPDGMKTSFEYRQILAAKFKDALSLDVRLRVIEETPFPFMPESATGMREENGTYRIFFIQP
jgi:hypothetical protein